MALARIHVNQKGSRLWGFILAGGGAGMRSGLQLFLVLIFFEDDVYGSDRFYALMLMDHAITVDSMSLKVSEVSALVGDGNYKYLVPA